MSDSKQLEDAVRDLIVDLCAVLYDHGYQQISVGALMRVIGVSESQAIKHDQEILDLLQHFANLDQIPKSVQVPPGTTFH